MVFGKEASWDAIFRTVGLVFVCYVFIICG